MAVGTGVTEIADSEEEPLTSSPAAVPDAAVDKLSARAGQDAQAVACPHQDLAEHTANQASSRTDLLDVDQKKPSTDIETTHTDHSDLLSQHHAETNDTSACAAKALLKADSSLQACFDAAGVKHQDSWSGTDTADGETGSLRDTGASPEAERAVSHMNEQNRLSESQGDHQPQLHGQLADGPGVIDVQQDSPCKDRLQDEAVDNHNATLKPSQSDPVRLASSEQEPVQHGYTCAISQKDLGAAENEAFAAELSHDTSHEATINPPNSNLTDHPDVTVTSGQTAPDTVNVPHSMDLGALTGAPDLTSSDVTSGRHETAAESSAPQGVSTSISGVGPQHANKLTATSSASALGAGYTTMRNDHEASDEASSAPGLPAQSKMTDGHDRPSDHHEHDSTTSGAATDNSILRENASTQKSTIASNEQGREEDHSPTGTGEEVAPGQPSEVPTQSTTGTVQSRCDHGSAVGDDQSPASKAPETQTESQSTASQASEPTSPHPTAKLSPQEITLAELRAQKATLLGSLRVQPAIQVLMEENQTSDVDMSDDDGEPTEADIMAAANKIVKEHIKLLHEYNELKDVGQGLMGLIADQRGVRIVEIQDEFGINAND